MQGVHGISRDISWVLLRLHRSWDWLLPPGLLGALRHSIHACMPVHMYGWYVCMVSIVPILCIAVFYVLYVLFVLFLCFVMYV